jgi:hypothetical protein
MSGESGHCPGHIAGDPGYLPGRYFEWDRDDSGAPEGDDPWWVPVVMITGIVMLFFGPLLIDVLVHVQLSEPAGRDRPRAWRGRSGRWWPPGAVRGLSGPRRPTRPGPSAWATCRRCMSFAEARGSHPHQLPEHIRITSTDATSTAPTRPSWSAGEDY